MRAISTMVGYLACSGVALRFGLSQGIVSALLVGVSIGLARGPRTDVSDFPREQALGVALGVAISTAFVIAVLGAATTVLVGLLGVSQPHLITAPAFCAHEFKVLTQSIMLFVVIRVGQPVHGKRSHSRRK